MNSLSFWSLILCIWILICLLFGGYAKSIFFLRELSQIFEKYILLNWIVQTTYSRKDSIKEGNFYKALTFSGAWVNLNLQWTNSLITNGTQGEIVSIGWKPSIARGRFCKRDMTHQPHTVLFNKFSQSINRSSWNLSANILNIASDSLLVISKLLTQKICKLSHQKEGSVKWCSSLVLEAQPPSSTNCNHFKILQFSKWWFLFIKRKH